MEQMYVRTTIRIPKKTHESLSKQAYTQKKSLNEVMLDKLGVNSKAGTRLKKFLAGEKKLEGIRKEYKLKKNNLNQTAIIREMRDERAYKL